MAHAKAKEGGKGGEKGVVFADLILTTGRGRVFHCSRFAIASLFIQVVGEPREIRSECAFCNTSLWILNTCGASSHTDARAASSRASADVFWDRPTQRPIRS